MEFIRFMLDRKEILSISVEGLMKGEIEATRSLLAHERGVAVEDIVVDPDCSINTFMTLKEG